MAIVIYNYSRIHRAVFLKFISPGRETMYCIQCGANNTDEALFCQRCGKSLKTETNDDDATLYSPPQQSAVYTSASPLSAQDNSAHSTPSALGQSPIAPTQYSAPPPSPYANSAY